MALVRLQLIVIQSIIFQVLASYSPYIQYAGTPYPIPAYVTGYPVQSFAPSSSPVFAPPYPQPASNYQPAPNLSSLKTPATPVGTSTSYTQTGSSFTPAHVPTPANSSPVYQPTAYQATAHQQPIKATSIAPPLTPDPPKLELIKPAEKTLLHSNPSLPKDLLLEASPPFDSNILNNLAIALQLLIISNLIHNPPPESKAESQAIDEDIFPAIAPFPIAFIPPSLPDPHSYSNQYIPNSNFLGTSSFVDTGISKSMMNAYGAPTLPAPRPSGLMSPYDAIGLNSPYIDPFQLKPDLKSPYHLTPDYKDLFSLTELFKI